MNHPFRSCPSQQLRRARPLAVLVLAAAVLSGCGVAETINEKGKIDYKSAGKLPPLEIPPDLVNPRGDDRFAVPDRPAGDANARTYSGFQRGQSTERASGEPRLLPTVAGAHIERSGTERWLVVDMPPDKVWPLVREFWQESGFILQTESPETGIMETDWAENRAKIPLDPIRSTIGKAFDSLYSTGERDKFRTRLEPGPNGGTEVYITHRGMIEVMNATKDSTVWQPRPPEPDLEAEFLRRLMVRLGADQERARQQVAQSGEGASAASTERIRLQSTGGTSWVEMNEGFDRAWRRVGLALDRGGFTVEDRDRSQGVYFVRYIDPDEQARAQKPGFFSRLFSSGSKKPGNTQEYRIKLDGSGDKTKVSVLTRDGKQVSTDADRRTSTQILALLQEQLKQ